IATALPYNAQPLFKVQDMTEPTPLYTAIWHSNGKCLAGWQPAAVLQADNAAALAGLPAQLADLLRPGQQAVGLTAYGSAGPATVQIFEQSNIREIPTDQPVR